MSVLYILFLFSLCLRDRRASRGFLLLFPELSDKGAPHLVFRRRGFGRLKMRFSVKRILLLRCPALPELLDRLQAHTLLRRGLVRRFFPKIRFTVKRIICAGFTFRRRGQSLQYLVGSVGGVGFHLVNSGIGLLLLIGYNRLPRLVELPFGRCYCPVASGLLDDLLCRSFPGRFHFQRVSPIPNQLSPASFFYGVSIHISRAPAWCSSAGIARSPAGSCSQRGSPRRTLGGGRGPAPRPSHNPFAYRRYAGARTARLGRSPPD